MTVGDEVHTDSELPKAHSVLAICAHPDDESFGLGAALSYFADSGTSTSVVCFTKGEASTLGVEGDDLGTVRAGELAAAAEELGVANVELLHHPDGALEDESLEDLIAETLGAVERAKPDLLLVFDEGGITGHPDHCRATRVAMEVGQRRGLAVLAWAVADHVAVVLNSEFGAGFVGRAKVDLDFEVKVDRSRQCRAINRHVSQSVDNPVLGRRLEVQGDEECFRWLLRSA